MKSLLHRVMRGGALAMALATAVQGCRKPADKPADKPAEVAAEKIVQSAHDDAVTVTLTVDPGVVQLGRNLTLTMTLTADAALDPQFPGIADRLQGLALDGQYDGDSSAANGKTARVRFFQLKPALAEEYRIGPMAVTYKGGWLGTPPIKLPAKRLADTNGGGVGDILPPIWIRPPFKTVALWVLSAFAAAAAFFGLWKLMHRVRRQIQLMRMSPRERALHELSALLQRDLPGKRLVKDFYFELTMIVRRYIERAHKVRAPEQTTEEFLDAVSRDSRFAQPTVDKLRAFLQSADLVKYAAHQPTPERIDQATGTARAYIETDAAEEAIATVAATPAGEER